MVYYTTIEVPYTVHLSSIHGALVVHFTTIGNAGLTNAFKELQDSALIWHKDTMKEGRKTSLVMHKDDYFLVRGLR